MPYLRLIPTAAARQRIMSVCLRLPKNKVLWIDTYALLWSPILPKHTTGSVKKTNKQTLFVPYGVSLQDQLILPIDLKMSFGQSNGTSAMLPMIVFNASKNEIFQVTDNYKTLHRKLKSNFRVDVNHKDIDKDVLKQAKLFILAGPQNKFTEEECEHMKNYVDTGGKIIILLGEGGELEFNTNINFLLEEYGMTINNDSVVRTQYYKYFHPKECMIGGGVVCEPMWRWLLAQPNISKIPFDFSDEKLKIQFVYPYGATLNVAHPSNILMTTGAVVYPFNRPVVGYFCNNRNGKIMAIGSGHMFHDKYIVEETNAAIWEYLVRTITDDTITFSSYDFNDVDINDNKLVPDTIFLAEQPKMCLLESIDCDIPADFKKMFDMRLHSINNDLLRNVIDAYQQLDVQYEPLKIIKPQFEIPLPPLQLAVFQPIFSDVQAPDLELFDLDEAFSSERAQITQLANKCLTVAEDSKTPVNEKELEYFIIECGRILGVFPENKTITAKEILYDIGVKIAKYKKLDRE